MGQSPCLLLFISTDQTWKHVNDQQKPEMQSSDFALEIGCERTDALE